VGPQRGQHGLRALFLAPLSVPEQAQFLQLLRRVADAAEGLRNPAEPFAVRG
jgi:hypothetical protein